MSKTLKLKFTDESMEQLDKLKDDSKSESRADVVRKALRFYEYTVSQAMKGYSVELVDKNTKTKQVLAPLSVD